MSETDKPGEDNSPETPSNSTESAAQSSASAQDSGTEQINQDKPDHNVGKIVERVLCMILFGFIGYFVFWAICLLALVQFIFSLVNGEANDDLKKFTANLAEYMRQIGAYLGYSSDERPCPFGAFPNVENA